MKRVLIILWLALIGQACFAGISRDITITIKIEDLDRMDPEILAREDNLCMDFFLEKFQDKPIVLRTVDAQVVAPGVYVFHLKGQTGSGYVSIRNKSRMSDIGVETYALENLFVESDDNVLIRFKIQSFNLSGLKGNYFNPYFYLKRLLSKYHPVFSGRGSLKYKAKYEADSTILRRPYREADANILDMAGDFNKSYYMLKCAEEGVAILDKYQKQISADSYNVLKADLIAGVGSSFVIAFVQNIRHPLIKNQKADSSGFMNFLHFFRQKMDKLEERISVAALSKSIFYPSYVASFYDTFQRIGDKYNLTNFLFQTNSQIVKFIIDRYRGNGRSRILLELIFYAAKGKKLNDSFFLVQIMSKVQNETHKELLLEFLANNIPGQAAFDFTLQDINGKEVSLHDFKNKVVFIDFWFTGCHGCSDYYEKVLRFVENKYKDQSDVVFISVSVDLSKDKWLESIKSEIYTSNHAVNLFTNGLGVQHPIIPNFKIKSYPRPMIIDRNGNIFNTDRKVLRANGADGLIATIESALKTGVMATK